MRTKNKLKKFKDLKTFKNVVEAEREKLLKDSFSKKGNWNKFFDNDNPIILELGCGSGEYTLNLARKYKDKNFIGVDIKGARFWGGAKIAIEEGLSNAAFLRMQIDLINMAFKKGEISEIWITFPDPQIKFKNKKHRLVNLDFLRKYKEILREDGLVHLKTDSEFLYGYLNGLLDALNIDPIYVNHHIYKSQQGVPDDVKDIKTLYEKGFVELGKDITYTSFKVDKL